MARWPCQLQPLLFTSSPLIKRWTNTVAVLRHTSVSFRSITSEGSILYVVMRLGCDVGPLRGWQPAYNNLHALVPPLWEPREVKMHSPPSSCSFAQTQRPMKNYTQPRMASKTTNRLKFGRDQHPPRTSLINTVFPQPKKGPTPLHSPIQYFTSVNWQSLPLPKTCLCGAPCVTVNVPSRQRGRRGRFDLWNAMPGVFYCTRVASPRPFLRLV